ncbi:MAG: hypothetical protein WBV94_32570 [Blastocatellia bacterium]
MESEYEHEELMVRYLCGEASPAESFRVEQNFFSDNDYFEKLLATEDALIDEYIKLNTPVSVRKRIEPLLISSDFQLRQVQFARYLMKRLFETAVENA